MKRAIFTITLIGLIFTSVGYIKAQNRLSPDNLEKPELEIIVGLNHPKHVDALQLQDIDAQDETDLPNTGIDGITLDDSQGDIEDDIIEDYLEDLLGENGGEPDKEELVLEKLKDDNINSVTLYPNPAINFINVKIEDLIYYEIEIYDLIGNKVITENVANIYGVDYKVDISSLQNGIYLMHIVMQNERLIKKFGVN